MAERCLKLTERKLAKNPEVAKSYQKVIDEYLEKNFIRQVPSDEPTPTTEWLLPHFPIVRPDTTTTETFGSDAETFHKLCNGLWRTILHDSRPRKGTSEAISVLFVCLQTHCCHLEMASSLETDAFLNAFTRMVARRVWPKLMISDNETNYVGATREIKKLVEDIDHESTYSPQSWTSIRKGPYLTVGAQSYYLGRLESPVPCARLQQKNFGS